MCLKRIKYLTITNTHALAVFALESGGAWKLGGLGVEKDCNSYLSWGERLVMNSMIQWRHDHANSSVSWWLLNGKCNLTLYNIVIPL